MIEINKVYNVDCLEGLKQIEDNSIDLILTDPPYNIGKDFENDNLPQEEYLKWCNEWIKECVRVLKVGGAFYLTLGFQCVAEIKVIFNEFNSLRLKNWIVWYRMDGWKTDKGFCHSSEHILYFIKDNVPLFDLEEFGKHIKQKRLEKGYKTVSDLMEAMGIYKKIKRKNGTEDYRSGNGFFESGKKKPSLQELILLNQLLKLDKKYTMFLEPIYKERLEFKEYLKEKIKKIYGNHYKLAEKMGIDESMVRFWMGTHGNNEVLPNEENYLKLKKLLKLGNKFDPLPFGVRFNKVDVHDDVWLTPKSEKSRLGHPTQKPEKLFRRMIQASSNEGDLILDIFMGSGTTAFACKSLKRNFIGFEIDKKYCDIINKRLAQEVLTFPNKKSSQ